MGADLEGAPVQHGLDGVDEQIEKDLLQAFLFAPDGRQVGGKILFHIDARQGQLVAHQLQGILDDRGDGQRFKFRALGPGEIQETLDDLRGPLGLGQDILDQPHGLFLGQVAENPPSGTRR